jgi:hypothetical protein
MSKSKFEINPTISHSFQDFLTKNKKRNYQIMYHITSQKNAKLILKNGFDLSKGKTFAFGRGINLTNDIKHLQHYSNKIINTIVLCIVKYNRLKHNPPYYKNRKSKESQEYLQKHGFTRPTYMNIPPTYDGFSYKSANIYVLKEKLVYPLLLLKS